MKFRLSARQLFALLLIAGLPFVQVPADAEETEEARGIPQVLILTQEQGYLPSLQLLTRGVTEELSAGESGALVYVEHLDLGRIRDQGLLQAQREWLARKYADIRFDVIVALGPDVLTAVREQLPSLVRDTPIVFWGVGEVVGDVRANEAGVASTVDVSRTVDLIMQLIPDTSRVVVIRGDARSDELLSAPFAASSDGGSPRIELVNGESLPELERRVSTFERGTVVLLTSMIRDRNGASHTSRGVATSLAGQSAVPVFVSVSTTIGVGTVGGVLLDFDQAGRAVGKAARAVLEGKPDALGGPVTSLPQSAVVDVLAMKRFQIPLSRLPDAVARINVPGLSPRYRLLLGIALAVVLLQGATIVALLLVRRQRARSAAELRERVADLEESRREQRRLAGHLLGAQENERRRVARELHDDITQRLSLLGLQLSTSAMSPPDSAVVRAAANKVSQLAADVSRLSHQLHPDLLHRIGLAAALRGLCRDSSEPGRFAIECQTSEVATQPPSAVALAVYRVAQEALRNVRKHSAATQATVSLSVEMNGLELIVADAGCGFDSVAAAQNGLGLTSMRERAEILGGNLKIESALGLGSRVRLWLPVSSGP